MEDEASPIDQVRLRAFDLGERTLSRSRRSAVRRVDRLRQRLFMILQCAVTAGLAWFLAQHLAGHPLPFFAPVAAIITLGITFGQRLRRGVEVAVGVALGVGIGDLWVTFFHPGVWQIMVICLVAMSLATLLGAGQLMMTQAGVQAIIVTTLAPTLGYGVNRWLDAVIGCGIALIVATIAPSAPLRRPRVLAASVLDEIASALDAARAALITKDDSAAEAVLDQARAGEKGLAALDQASAEGLAVVRHSPFRRGQLPGVTALADLRDPLDHAVRNLRVLARRCVVAVWRKNEIPSGYLTAIADLSSACRFMAGELRHYRLPRAARERLEVIGRATAHLPVDESLSAVVILAQIRSMTADLLELTGMDYEHARELIPDMD
jgi:uncharacterized membrane protein YgaE (UPF0421/DUF939 family)